MCEHTFFSSIYGKFHFTEKRIPENERKTRFQSKFSKESLRDLAQIKQKLPDKHIPGAKSYLTLQEHHRFPEKPNVKFEETSERIKQ